MAEDAVVQTDPPADNPPPGKGGPVGQIHEDVQALIASRHPEVREAIVRELADEKLEERKKQVRTALGKWKEAKAALQKIKPENKAYNAEGQVVSESYTKAQVDEMKKNKEQLTKIETALDEALGRANYEKLQKVAG